MTQLASARVPVDVRALSEEHRLALERRQVQVSVWLLLCGSFLGWSILQTSGALSKLAFSNIFHIVALVLILPSLRRVPITRLAVLLITAGAILVSALSLELLHDVSVPTFQTVYFVLFGFYLLILASLPHEVLSREDLKGVVRWAVPVVLAIAVLAGAYDFLITGVRYADLSFDDKSHAANACLIFAFLALWAYRNTSRLVISMAFLLLAVSTASRLPLVGAPLLVLAMLHEYWRSLRNARSPVVPITLALSTIVGGFLALRVVTGGFTEAFTERTTSGTITTDRATLAHLELIQMAAHVKIADAWYAFIGYAPGGFAQALEIQNVSTARFGALDPPGYDALLLGFVPVHSVPMSILVEFPIWVVVIYIGFWIHVIRMTWLRREWTLLALALCIQVITVFYSSHNELYYLAACAVLVLATRPEPPGADDPDPEPRSEAVNARAVARAARASRPALLQTQRRVVDRDLARTPRP